jgi:hypothetical protein
MQLPIPDDRYRKDIEVKRNGILNNADLQNRKKGADVELSTDRLILHAPNGSRWQITVSNAGVVGAAAL